LKAQVTDAPGYAAFAIYDISFLVGDAGGSGLAHDSGTKKVTEMSRAPVRAGPVVRLRFAGKHGAVVMIRFGNT
jgi:hypothetical protein